MLTSRTNCSLKLRPDEDLTRKLKSAPRDAVTLIETGQGPAPGGMFEVSYIIITRWNGGAP